MYTAHETTSVECWRAESELVYMLSQSDIEALVQRLLTMARSLITVSEYSIIKRLEYPD